MKKTIILSSCAAVLLGVSMGVLAIHTNVFITITNSSGTPVYWEGAPSTNQGYSYTKKPSSNPIQNGAKGEFTINFDAGSLDTANIYLGTTRKGSSNKCMVKATSNNVSVSSSACSVSCRYITTCTVTVK